MYTATLNSAGCLPDSDFWPIEFESPRDAWSFIASEIELINDDGDYLAAHTMLHFQDWDSVGSIPAGESTLYAYRVEHA